MEFPEGLRYTKDHEWVKLDGSLATVGITEFAQSELGEIVFADLPKPGKTVKQKDALCVVESTKAASDVYAPISGTVKESNAALNDTPDLINREPYTGGWLAKLENFKPEELESLMSASEYSQHVGK